MKEKYIKLEGKIKKRNKIKKEIEEYRSQIKQWERELGFVRKPQEKVINQGESSEKRSKTN